MVSSRTGAETANDPSPYSSVYPRDRGPLGPDENLVGFVTVADATVGGGVPHGPLADVESWLRRPHLVLGNLEPVIGDDPAVDSADTDASATEVLSHVPPSVAATLHEASAIPIVSDHPQVIEPLEIHEKQVVTYSLGSLVFRQQQEETGRGLALQAVQAIPLWTGPRPRLMGPEEAVSFLKRVTPARPRLHFACDNVTCRELDGPPGRHMKIGPTLFWGGEIDLTGDGDAEQVRRERERVIIYEDGVEAWRSPSSWRVVDVALGDVTDDGRNELVLALWKQGLDGLEPPDPAKESMLRNWPFIVGYRGGIYRTLWGGSAVVLPIQEIQLAHVDGDATRELVVLEGEDAEARTVSVWSWHGWGFTLRWRSSPGPYGELAVDDAGIISVTAQ